MGVFQLWGKARARVKTGLEAPLRLLVLPSRPSSGSRWRRRWLRVTSAPAMDETAAHQTDWKGGGDQAGSQRGTLVPDRIHYSLTDAV